MQLTAKLVQVLPVQTGTGKNGEWRKHTIVVETDGMYPKKICITIWGDKASPEVLKEGNMLDISFDLESREFNGRWYTDVKAWKVELAGASSGGGDYPAPSNAAPAAPVDFGDSGDDLPF
ncbi:DUF3127 domain-containing protein [Dysgonomonas sp. 25]|uniref:DUF3127 domain-containing protein n=1 Tax=Dysgonomonas sp. 25 TaxID=2302933 RepID=UPI0013CFB730|nr:DUF3127 domain-containing protein [Dysgonomonas sp. 25]NDV68026.1 DUF3127 domain-containing protein [Dysgonomonas sp. 25]